MNREYVAWDSPALGRKMELLWFGHGGRPMIWFPTSKGRFYQNEDFGLIAAVSDLIENGQIQVCCVDSVDDESFYAENRHPAERIHRHDQYDRYVYAEVVPFVRDKGRTGAKIGTLGTSFGAYHAVNFGLRHPDVCDKVVGFSGKYDIHSFLDDYWDELCYFHCPTSYVPNMDGEWVAKLSTMDIAVITGETDNILSGTTDMMRIFNEKGIRNRNSVWAAPYGHDWLWWKEQIRHYVP
jgi:esterase/lipase superfamily enzyme